MNEFHFLRPEWFWGFSAFLLLFFVRSNRSQGGLWQQLCDGVLLRFQLVRGNGKRLFLPFFLTLGAWTVALISLAGPTWEKLPQPAVKKGMDTVYALDISILMTPQDVKPSRMERARFKMHDFLQKTKDGQNALILYNRDPFVAVPLTTDKHIIDNQLPTVQAGMMGADMPNAATALEKAFELLTQAKSTEGRVIVLSGYMADDDLSEVLKTAEKIKAAGHTVSFLGVGTNRGAPLQLPDGTFLTHQGKPVLSGLSEKNMKKAALAGGGSYQRVTLDERDIDALLNALPVREISPLFSEQEKAKADTWKDFGAVLCIFVLPFAAFGYRKGWLGVWLLFVLLVPSPARAWSLSDLWTRPDRKEALRISAGEKPQNPDVFRDKNWQAAAAYKAGDYPTAISALAESTEAEEFYNQGNALAQAGQYQQAIETYKKALEKNPGHEDAAFNKKYLEDQLKNNQQNQQQNQKQNQQQKDQNQQQNQKQQQGQNEQNQEQQNQRQNQSQQQKQEQNQQQNDRQQNQNRQQDQNQQQEQNQQKEQNQRQNQSDQEQSQRKEEQKNQPKNDGRQPSDQKADRQDSEKQEQMQWLSVIEDDPSGLLRERIRRRNLTKGRRR